MKAKKTAPSRRRVSFAVDRDEIEINSDWVAAVMTSPVVPFPAPPEVAPPSVPKEDLFFAPCENTATDAEIATGARCTPVENSAAVDQVASVAQITAVENQAPVENDTAVAELATVAGDLAPEIESEPNLTVEHNATVADIATGAEYTTDAEYASTKAHRLPRPRPIHRVTDGLTPGQYAVYSLMYEAGEESGAHSRIYKGGYADLGRLTGLSKRGIQNIVAELQAKKALQLHQQPGYHRTETSAYLVPDPESLLHSWRANGWRHAYGKSKTLKS